MFAGTATTQVTTSKTHRDVGRGQDFFVGSGCTMPILGEKKLSMQVPNGSGETIMIASVFQSAQVIRPFLSVGRVWDEGFEVRFTDGTVVLSLTDLPRPFKKLKALDFDNAEEGPGPDVVAALDARA